MDPLNKTLFAFAAYNAGYVSNIFKYYVAYKLVTEDQQAREKARQSLTQ